MSRTRILLAAAAILLAVAAPALTQPKGKPAAPAAPPRPAPKREPVAETRLLMEGLNLSNFRGLERLLKDKPADVEAWTFIRGQALLIAETGNLLLLRPPRNQGRDTWMKEAMDMRQAAGTLARQLGGRDYERSKVALAELRVACNHCHQTFRVPVKVAPPAAARDAE